MQTYTFSIMICLASALSTEAFLPHTDPENRGAWVLNTQISDEFDGNALDTSKWIIQGANGHYENGFIGRAPSQFTPNNVSVSNGYMLITTKWEPDFDFSTADSTSANSSGSYSNVTTGAVISRHQFLYGYMETRCKAARGPVSSSFWTTGTGGELDVFEHWGRPENHYSDHRYHSSFHDWRTNPKRSTYGTRIWTNDHMLDFAVHEDFHIYGLEWAPDYIKIYVDGRLIEYQTRTEIGDAWVVNHAQKVWLDSETFPWELNGAEIVESDFPGGSTDYVVDYVRIWNMDGTGTGTPVVSNLITDADFAEGSASWTLSGAAAVTTDPETGGPAAHLSAAGRVAQTVSVEPDTVYVLSADVRLPGTDMQQVWHNAYLGVENYGGAGAVRQRYFHPYYYSRSLQFKTGPDTTSVNIYVENDSRAHPTYIDHVELLTAEDVPAPDPVRWDFSDPALFADGPLGGQQGWSGAHDIAGGVLVLDTENDWYSVWQTNGMQADRAENEFAVSATFSFTESPAFMDARQFMNVSLNDEPVNGSEFRAAFLRHDADTYAIRIYDDQTPAASFGYTVFSRTLLGLGSKQTSDLLTLSLKMYKGATAADWMYAIALTNETSGQVVAAADGTLASQQPIFEAATLYGGIGGGQISGGATDRVVYTAAIEARAGTPPSGSEPPAFSGDFFDLPDAEKGQAYHASVASFVSDPEGDPLTFFKTAGPDWLVVSPKGSLTGTPGEGDVGPAVVTVRVVADGGSDLAELNLKVITSAPLWDEYTAMYELSGIDTNDFDSDGVSDRDEYLFGGNPTNGLDRGHVPVFDPGTGAYRFRLRNDTSVVARVLSCTNLVVSDWTTNISVTATAHDGSMQEHTALISLFDPQRYIKLAVDDTPVSAPPIAGNTTNTVIGGSIGNGDFNAVGAGSGKQPFSASPFWFNAGGAETETLTATDFMGGSSDDPANTPGAVSTRGVVQINSTGHIVEAAGETFSLRYEFGAAGNASIWDGTTVHRTFLFTTDSTVNENLNTYTEVAANEYVLNRATGGQSQWTRPRFDNFYTTTAADIGKTFHFGMELRDADGSNNGNSGRIDVIELTVVH